VYVVVITQSREKGRSERKIILALHRRDQTLNFLTFQFSKMRIFVPLLNFFSTVRF
jgi:hypothetical protein